MRVDSGRDEIPCSLALNVPSAMSHSRQIGFGDVDGWAIAADDAAVPDENPRLFTNAISFGADIQVHDSVTRSIGHLFLESITNVRSALIQRVLQVGLRDSESDMFFLECPGI
jgi:hypothetical protein